jgi:hypothetical protein
MRLRLLVQEEKRVARKFDEQVRIQKRCVTMRQERHGRRSAKRLTGMESASKDLGWQVSKGQKRDAWPADSAELRKCRVPNESSG